MAQLLRLWSTEHRRREGSVEESCIKEAVADDSASRREGAGGLKFPFCVRVSWLACGGCYLVLSWVQRNLSVFLSSLSSCAKRKINLGCTCTCGHSAAVV